jgi:hypothetical protein
MLMQYISVELLFFHTWPISGIRARVKSMSAYYFVHEIPYTLSIACPSVVLSSSQFHQQSLFPQLSLSPSRIRVSSVFLAVDFSIPFRPISSNHFCIRFLVNQEEVECICNMCVFEEKISGMMVKLLDVYDRFLLSLDSMRE